MNKLIKNPLPKDWEKHTLQGELVEWLDGFFLYRDNEKIYVAVEYSENNPLVSVVNLDREMTFEESSKCVQELFPEHSISEEYESRPGVWVLRVLTES